MWSLFIVLLLTAAFLLSRTVLDSGQQPRKSDVIIVLSGDRGRLEKAMSLYEKGYAKNIMLSTPVGFERKLKNKLRSEIPKDNFIVENNASTTYTNATYTRELAKKHHFKSAIVVSSDYHIRRAKLVFDRVYQGTGMRLTYVSSTKHLAKPWFMDALEVKITLSEYVKLIGYYFELYKTVDNQAKGE
ncbi:YdcF family protein [Metabacillus sp. RGM 3146]|uniref:YdcF family protein n=1 Tax=Metabacillus sp. RGM 3146 TaxID=3401092 RepID=UPI003B9C6D93